MEFVYESGQIFVDSGKKSAIGVIDKDSNHLTLSWDIVLLNVSKVEVVLNVDLNDTSSISNWNLSVEIMDGEPNAVGLWSATLSVPVSTGSGEDGELFYPSGYGEAYSDPISNTGGSVDGSYPSGGVAMQFMALCDGGKEPSSGFYMSALDGSGSIKDLQFSSMAYQLASPPSHRHLNTAAATLSMNRNSAYAAKVASQQPDIYGRNISANIIPMSILSITMYPEDSGAAMSVGSSWKSPYAVGVGVISGVSAAKGKPLWYEASKIYRDWALRSAPWVSKTLKQRDGLPDWYRDNSIWINTHWQCHDVFNDEGGDPLVVLENTRLIADLLEEPSLALHWYEWQQGPDPAPEARYKFDTHYPDYFPPRGNNTGEQFLNVVKTLMKEYNVYTVPYINGRIFDINSESYLSDNGSAVCSMNMEDMLYDPASADPTRSNLEPYLEDYGNNCTFCVADPATPYWQQKIGDVVVELTNDWQVPGVYIDQIGAAGPKLCWDSEHDHHLGGGTYWTEGYEDMLSAMNARTQKDAQGKHPPIVTENNAEPYMDTLQGYLVLTAFKKSLAMSFTNPIPGHESQRNRRLAPAFPAIYGGYYVGFGAEWFVTDFEDHDWWCGKLSAMFVTGAQMGWFSLLGTVDPSDSCGEMGVGSLLLDSANEDLIDYMKLLSSSRRVVTDYMVDGHMLGPIVMEPPIASRRQTVKGGGMDYLDYDVISNSVWKLDKEHTTLALFASTVEGPGGIYSGKAHIDFVAWGYDPSATLEVRCISKDTKQLHKAVTITGPIASIPIHIPSRDLVMLEFRSVTP